MADISTLVSLLPYNLDMDRPTCIPANFFIPGNKEMGDLQFIHIPRCAVDIYIDGERGYQRVPLLSEEMAASIVHDHINSCISVSIGIAEPGLFFVPTKVGETDDRNDKVKYELSKQQLRKALSKEINDAVEKQRMWFIRLVEEADHAWAKLRSPKAVSNLQRRAARYLNLRKDWDIEEIAANISRCPACKELVNTGAIKCGKCGFIIDEAEYKKIRDRFVTI